MEPQEVWRRIAAKVGGTSQAIGVALPHVSKEGVYDHAPHSWWTNGFWSGLLWLVYRDTREERLREIAGGCERLLDAALESYTGLHHDVGFMWTLTSVANYKTTGEEDSRRRALHAANLLAGRFNIRGRFIRAWNLDRHGWAIIDSMMNLALLYWASGETGDSRYKHIAMAHADTVLKHFIRPDGSVRHIVCFDPDTGEVTEVKGGQGYAPESAWSRGASWAIYGMALSYRYTGKREYLDAARRAAHYFCTCLPEDAVPPWDFRAPPERPAVVDTSAGAIAASGMLEIARFAEESEQRVFTSWAVKLLEAIYDRYGRFDSVHQELIGGGTGNRPEMKHVHVGLIYGDYFFAEAIAKLNDPKLELFW